MSKYSFYKIKEKFSGEFAANWEPELTLYMYGKEYMIIFFGDNRCTFQRCGSKGVGSGEVWYDSFDELYNTETVDGILLKRDWNDITEFDCFEYKLYYKEDF